LKIPCWIFFFFFRLFQKNQNLRLLPWKFVMLSWIKSFKSHKFLTFFVQHQILKIYWICKFIWKGHEYFLMVITYKIYQTFEFFFVKIWTRIHTQLHSICFWFWYVWCTSTFLFKLHIKSVDIFHNMVFHMVIMSQWTFNWI
jgi:hypothetical protein